MKKNSETTLSIIDYGVCNIGSMVNMSRKIGFNVEIATKPKDIHKATHILLPGVGAFDQGIIALRSSGLLETLIEKMHVNPVPLLGVCLGMQLLCEGSEEGDLPGLGLISGFCRHFKIEKNSTLRVPHMGWNEVQFSKASPLSLSLQVDARFYFTHSYHMNCNDTNDVLATANHGGHFTAAVQKKNVSGVQFHPEKSHRFGMIFFQNFGSWNA